SASSRCTSRASCATRRRSRARSGRFSIARSRTERWSTCATSPRAAARDERRRALRDRPLAAARPPRARELRLRRDRGRERAGVARAASQRGWRVAVLEARDYASGTSSRSTKLIHGGLRYLAMGDVALVRKTALERKEIFRMAPHLCERRWMVVPARSYAAL